MGLDPGSRRAGGEGTYYSSGSVVEETGPELITLERLWRRFYRENTGTGTEWYPTTPQPSSVWVVRVIVSDDDYTVDEGWWAGPRGRRPTCGSRTLTFYPVTGRPLHLLSRSHVPGTHRIE